MTSPFTLTPALSNFYSALGMHNNAAVGSSLREVFDPASFTYGTAAMLLPAVQALAEVDPRSSGPALKALFLPEADSDRLIDHFERMHPAALGRVSDLLTNPDASGLFRAPEEILNAVRETILAARARKPASPHGEVAVSETFTAEDTVFAKAMHLQGTWTRQQLLALTLHIYSSLNLRGHAGRLWLCYIYFAELCRLSDAEILQHRNGIGPGNLPELKDALATHGLTTGMTIGKIDVCALGGYALYRHDLQPGDQGLLDMELNALPQGLPLTDLQIRYLREERGIRTVGELQRRFGEIPYYSIAASWITLDILGFRDRLPALDDAFFQHISSVRSDDPKRVFLATLQALRAGK